jgi:hypothetical protein
VSTGSLEPSFDSRDREAPSQIWLQPLDCILKLLRESPSG